MARKPINPGNVTRPADLRYAAEAKVRDNFNAIYAAFSDQFGTVITPPSIINPGTPERRGEPFDDIVRKVNRNFLDFYVRLSIALGRPVSPPFLIDTGKQLRTAAERIEVLTELDHDFVDAFVLVQNVNSPGSIGGSLTAALDALGLSATAVSNAGANLNASIGNLALSSTVTLPVAGTLSATVGAVDGVNLTAIVLTIGGSSLISDISAVTLAATGAIAVQATLTATMDPITVSASTGSVVAWTPDVLGTAVAWFDASDGTTITQSAGVVSAWASKVGGITASQATSGKRPTYSSTARNGRPGLIFDGTDDALDISSVAAFPAGSAAGTIVSVAYTVATGWRYTISYGPFNTNGSRQLGVDPSGKVLADTYGSGETHSTSWNADRIAIGEFSGTTVSAVVDGGTKETTTTSTLVTSLTSGRIGGYANSTGGDFWNGVIQEELVFTGLLSDSDRQKLEGYLAHKWGLAAQLPADHPFKAAPPTYAPIQPTGTLTATLPAITVSATASQARLWTPADLSTGPRLWVRHRNAAWTGSALASMAHSGTDTTNSKLLQSSSVDIVKGAALGGYDSVSMPTGSSLLRYNLGAFSAGAISVFSLTRPLSLAGNGLLHGPSAGNGTWTQFGTVGIYTFATTYGPFATGNGWGFGNAPRTEASSYTPTIGSWQIQGWRLGSGVNTVRALGSALTMTTNNSASTPSYSASGWVVGNVDQGTEGLRSDLAEVMLFDYALSDADMQRLEGWAAHEYGLTAQLPSDHPYKTSAPVYTAPAPSTGIPFGVNIGAGTYGPQPGNIYTDYNYPTTQEVDYAYSQGIRMFRVGFQWRRAVTWTGSNPNKTITGLQSAFTSNFIPAVNYILNKGSDVVVVLDLHDYGDWLQNNVGRDTEGGNPAGTRAQDALGMADMWNRILTAGSWKSLQNRVWLGLMNEPAFAGDWGAVAQLTLTNLRNLGITNKITLAAFAYSGAHAATSNGSSTFFASVTDSANNWCAEVHQYFDFDYSGTHTDASTAGVDAMTNILNHARANGYKILVGETAFPNNSSGDTVRLAFLNKMKSYNDVVIGVTYWIFAAWSPLNAYDFGLTLDAGSGNVTASALLTKLIADRNTVG